jgi:hypothetical protein
MWFSIHTGGERRNPPFVLANPRFVANGLPARRRAATMLRMKHGALLVVTSLLSIGLLTLHVTDDIVRGISRAEPSNTALVVLVMFLYGTLVLAERRSGSIIMLLVGLFAAAMPVVHMRGAHYSEIARSAGGFFFVWTLWALGGLGGLTFVLSARRLWSLPWRRPK